MLKRTIENIYRQRAKHYDLAVALFLGAFGFRYATYRAHAIERLHLHMGDVVVDLGCGTGLSFASILDRIGPSGRLLGVDLSEGMLTQARARVDGNGWDNVELIQSDMPYHHHHDDPDDQRASCQQNVHLATHQQTWKPARYQLVARGTNRARS